ncbi:hypothetical protein IG631_05606 [Alternaria alternata]|nr:hypothetical protein IG631_05606 [Alternaria alternata]
MAHTAMPVKLQSINVESRCSQCRLFRPLFEYLHRLLPSAQNPFIRSSGLLDNKSCGVGRQSAYCTLAADRGKMTLF